MTPTPRPTPTPTTASPSPEPSPEPSPGPEPSPEPSPSRTEAELIRALIRSTRSDYSAFNAKVLGRGAYWGRQREIGRSLVAVPTTLVATGNGVGKTYFDAGAILGFLFTHPGSLVLATAPSQTQLEEVLWKEVERAYRGARVPLGGRLLKDPLKIDLGGEWKALAYSTSKVERLSGHHGEHILAVLDEASGVADEVNEAIASCNPSRKLATGNPLWPRGWFYDACTQARARADDPACLSRLIVIPSTESPDIHRVRSPRGLADATWLEQQRQDYGEGSLWWLPHVLARFPDSAEDQVIPTEWLDSAARAPHVRSGPARCAIDLAAGTGCDRSAIVVRDSGGILAWESSNRWDLEATAARAALLIARHRVAHHRVSWDVGGLGADFANRLEAEGIYGAEPYRGGGAEGGRRYANLRAAAAWALRQRLDPKRMVRSGPGGILRAQVPFAIPAEFLRAGARQELAGLRYQLAASDKVVLERKEDLARRLRRSPDLADVLIQSFAFAPE